MEDISLVLRKTELVNRILKEILKIVEKVNANNSSSWYIVNEKSDEALLHLKVFERLKKLWLKIENPHYFHHEMDDSLEVIELGSRYETVNAKLRTFLERIEEKERLKNLVLDAMPPEEELSELELARLEEIMHLMQNDERIRNYMDYDVAQLEVDWNGEKLLDKAEGLMASMEGLV